MNEARPDLARRSARIADALFGAFLCAMGVAILWFADRPLSAGPILAAIALALLGVDALSGALRNRPSLVSRIGCQA